MKHRIEIIARGLICVQRRVLLCKCIRGGFYYLPGGHVEFRESAQAALVRELREELGRQSAVKELLIVHESTFSDRKRPHHEVNLVFRVELDGDEHVLSREPDLAFEWIGVDQIVSIDLRPRSLARRLEAGDIGPEIEWISDMDREIEPKPLDA